MTGAHRLLVAQFVKEDIEKLVRVSPDDEAALAFLRDFLIEGGIVGPSLDKCCALIEQADVSASQRRAAVFAVLEHAKRSAYIPEQLLDLFDEASVPELRQLVRSETTPERFHFAAGAALAHLGDAEILPDLEERREAFSTEEAELVKHYNNYFDDWIWRIEIQTPPTRLLDYIATVAPDPPGRREHDWALRRAVKRGIDPTEIREAVLRNHESAHSKYGRLMLKNLKAEGLRLGVLQQNDLADVEAYEAWWIR
jgi:hypothetical protein